jgi:hypothetical protein
LKGVRRGSHKGILSKRSVFDRYDIISHDDITSVAQRTEDYLNARKNAVPKLRRVK